MPIKLIIKRKSFVSHKTRAGQKLKDMKKKTGGGEKALK